MGARWTVLLFFCVLLLKQSRWKLGYDTLIFDIRYSIWPMQPLFLYTIVAGIGYSKANRRCIQSAVGPTPTRARAFAML